MKGFFTSIAWSLHFYFIFFSKAPTFIQAAKGMLFFLFKKKEQPGANKMSKTKREVFIR